MIISATPTNPDRAAIVLWGVNRTKLRNAGYTLSELLNDAPPGEPRDRLQVIVRQVESLDRFITSRRIEVPDDILDEMMDSVPDTWVAELIGWSRAEIRYRRRKRGLAIGQRGGKFGDQAENRTIRTAWNEQWTQRLRDLDLWPH